MRIATKYVFIICPQRDALESDKDKPLTELKEHLSRYFDVKKYSSDEHHSRWTCESFCEMCEWICAQDFGAGWKVFKTEDPDRKAGNGFTMVLKRKDA